MKMSMEDWWSETDRGRGGVLGEKPVLMSEYIHLRYTAVTNVNFAPKYKIHISQYTRKLVSTVNKNCFIPQNCSKLSSLLTSYKA